MRVRYSGPEGQYPVYTCRDAHHEQDLPRCQETRALALDAAVEQHLLAALEPDKLALALAALEQLERETDTLQRQWQLRLERARYEAERARRQYHAAEPEHRLVARNLERHWEEKLRAVDELEHTHQRWLSQQPFTLTDSDREAILALGEDLPAVWQAPTTTSADRKHLLRLVIESVIVDAKRERGHLWYQINWQTGATSEHRLTRAVQRWDEHPQFDALQQRARELSSARKMDAEIAAILNAEGFRTARGRCFKSANVWRIRQQWQLPSVKESGNNPQPPRWADGTYSIAGAAATVGVTLGTVYKWVREGRVKAQQLAKGMPWKLALTDAQITSLQTYIKRVRRIKRSTTEAV
jgi:hypothetical protein